MPSPKPAAISAAERGSPSRSTSAISNAVIATAAPRNGQSVERALAGVGAIAPWVRVVLTKVY